MRRLFVAVVLGTAMIAQVQAQPVGDFDQMARNPIVTVRISEGLKSPPNEATLTISTRGRAPTASAALQENNQKTEALVAAIRRAGIADRDIQTQGVRLSQDFSYEPVAGRPNRRFVGYVSTNSVRIKTREIGLLSRLLDQLTEAGAEEISGPYFGIADPAPLRREARRRAMQRGIAEATEYAVNAGFRRVTLLSVEEGVSYRSADVVVTGSRISEAAIAPPAPPPPPPPGGSIQPGQIETTVQLTLQYRMER
jgi:uncharacterized protein YggE